MEETKAAEAKPAAKGFDFGATLKNICGITKKVAIKPASNAKEVDAFKDAKTSLIAAGLIVIVSTIINVLNAMISSIFVKSCSLLGLKCETKIDFGQLGNVNYLQAIGYGLLFAAGAIVLMAGVSYIIALIMKKQVNFVKLLGIVAVAIVPYMILSIVITLLGNIWTDGTIILSVATCAYTGALLISLIDREVALEGDKKIFYHFITITVTFIVTYFIVTVILKDLFAGLLLGGLSSGFSF